MLFISVLEQTLAEITKVKTAPCEKGNIRLAEYLGVSRKTIERWKKGLLPFAQKQEHYINMMQDVLTGKVKL